MKGSFAPLVVVVALLTSVLSAAQARGPAVEKGRGLSRPLPFVTCKFKSSILKREGLCPMATVQIEIPDQKAATYKICAQARGLTVEQWFLQLAEQSAPASSADHQASADDRPISQIIAEIMKDVPREAFASLPKDGASQVDHYVYGLPKRY